MSLPTSHPAPATESASNTNGSPTHSKSPRRESSPSVFRKFAPIIWIGGLACVLGATAYFFLGFVRGAREPYNGPVFEVKKQKLLVQIVERGSLESAENSDIIVRVKAGAKGSTSASIIKWIIEDGAQVRAGDRIVELDDSGFQDQLKTQRNTVQKASAELIEAKTNTTIQDIQNEIDIKSAEVVRDLKELDLKKYVGHLAGTKVVRIDTRHDLQNYLSSDVENDLFAAGIGALPRSVQKFLSSGFEIDVRKESAQAAEKFTSGFLQTISDLEGKIETARSDRETWLDRASWSQRMVKKGYFSRSQAEGDQSRLASSEITLRRVQGDLDIYLKFDLEKAATMMWSDLKEAERALKKVIKQADLKMEKARADEVAKRSIYEQEIDRLREMEKDEKWYRMVSPQDGMVVYYVPEQSRSGSGSQQSMVAQGEPVREGQKLMRIPNLSKMVVNARVHEAMVGKLTGKGEQTKPTYFSDTLRATFTLGRHDLFGLASYYGAMEELRDEMKEQDYTVTFPGLKARIKIDAKPGKTFNGHVKTVAAVAAQSEFFSSDIKVYQTMVAIDDLAVDDELRPGMSAEVTITADETSEPVLIIPIQAVLGNLAMGEKRKCFVLDANNYPHLRDIVVGKSSDKFAEVKEGLQEGDRVALNTTPLVGERSGLKAGTPSTRRGADAEDGEGKKGGKKKDGKGGKGGNLQPKGGAEKAFQRSEELPPELYPARKK